MSQFWYSDETATRLAEEVIQHAGTQGRLVHFYLLHLLVKLTYKIPNQFALSYSDFHIMWN